MAVKVMVAPAIANGEVGSAPRARPARPPDAPERQRRRRSSVYDANGNEVFITLMCLKCHKVKPLGQFGLRRMADGAIRNQPWCRTCRSAPAADAPADQKKGRKAAPVEVEDSPISEDSPGIEGSGADPAKRTGSLSAGVAAALAAGRR